MELTNIQKIFTDYYDAHDIPGDRRYVPAMVIGDKYLFLKDEIVPGLMEALYRGEGLKRVEELKEREGYMWLYRARRMEIRLVFICVNGYVSGLLALGRRDTCIHVIVLSA